MAFRAVQLTLVANTATACVVLGDGTGTTFKNVGGTVQDPLPIIIKNEDGAAVVWWGGSNAVDATHGQSIPAGGSVPMNVYGNDLPWVFSTGTPVVSVVCGRQ